MASQVWTAYKLRLATAGAADDWRCVLCMTNTNAGSVADSAVTTLADINLDEFDGANYTRQSLSTTASRDAAAGRAEINAPSFTFSSLGNGARGIQGALIYQHVGADPSNTPIRYIERTSPLSPGGEDVTVIPDADGIYQIT